MGTKLGIDVGYGDLKATFGDKSGNIIKMWKFNSVLAQVLKSDLLSDLRIIDFKDKSYYIGQDALRMPLSSIIDVSDYSRLEYFSPLFTKKIVDDLVAEGYEVPDTIVLGLSIAQVKNSAYYKSSIEEYLKSFNIHSKIVVIPQGIGSKICYDKFGDNFPEVNTNISDYLDYVLADLGMDTVDVIRVMGGKSSPSTVKGIEGEGAVKIVRKLIIALKTMYNVDFSIKEAKEVLDTGEFRVRGRLFDVRNVIKTLVDEYVEGLMKLIEDQFGDVLNKVDRLRLCGGGAYFLKSYTSEFVVIPKTKSEFYNSIGQYYHAVESYK